MAEIPPSVPNVSHSTSSVIETKRAQEFASEPPSAETLRKVEDYIVLDREGNKHTFKSLYAGPASRVMVVFIRHFFCGSCQEFIRALAESIKPDQLSRLPVTTSIVIIGCGDPGLIDHYHKETGCSFPIYTDPSRKLYADLNMVTSHALGERPEYFRKSMVHLVAGSIMQSLKHISSGLMTKGGESSQNGGEFLFESGDDKQVRVTWCHRMTNTRDHSSIPTLARVLDPEHTVLQFNN